MVEHDLWDRLLAEVNNQLESQNIVMTQGRINIIDAIPVEAARSDADGQPKRYSDAGRHVKNDNRGLNKSTYGFSVHTVLMKMVLYIDKVLHQVMFMMVKNVTLYTLEMKVGHMSMLFIVQRRPE